MQTRVGELYSLIRFLRIFPYAFYFCGAGTAKTSKIPPCDCRSLDHPFKQNHRKCDHCGCGRLSCIARPHWALLAAAVLLCGFRFTCACLSITGAIWLHGEAQEMPVR